MTQNQKSTTTQTDYDGAWKEAIEQYFEEFMAFFLPEAHQEIDWSQGYEFLDQELQQVVRDAELGLHRVDKLAKVWRKDGAESWVLVHIEVQSQKEEGFEKRVYTYNYRIFDKYDRTVVSLAILGDQVSDWKPDEFGYGLWGCEVQFTFPVVKLEDYRAKWTTLEANPNPFAVVVMAHLKMKETRRKPVDRRAWKMSLIKMLYQRGHTRQDILNLMNFIDWIMWLPEELEKGFWQEIRTYEEVEEVPHVLGAVRIAKEEGIEEGLKLGMQQTHEKIRKELLDGILVTAEVKFGPSGLNLMPILNKIHDIEFLRSFRNRLKTSDTLDDLQRICQMFLQEPQQQMLREIEWSLDLKFGQDSLKYLIEIRKIKDVTTLQLIRDKLKEVDTIETLVEYYQKYLPTDNEDIT